MAGATTLNGGITAGDKTLVVNNGSSFPTSGFRVLIDAEQILVYRNAGTSWYGLERGVNGTTAASHSNGASVIEQVVTAEMAVREGEVLVTYDKLTPHPQHRRRVTSHARF